MRKTSGMKRPTKLRTRALEVGALNKAGGGRGTYCGSQLHCDNCGCTYDVMCAVGGAIDGGYNYMFGGFQFAAYCPSCGTAS